MTPMCVAGVARLSAQQLQDLVQQLVRDDAPTAWADAHRALVRGNVTGESLAPHLVTPEALDRFFADNLSCDLSVPVAAELRAVIFAFAPQDGHLSNGGDREERDRHKAASSTRRDRDEGCADHMGFTA